MTRIAFPTLCVAALTAIAVGASPAGAQCRLCAAPTTAPEAAGGPADIRLEIESSVDFNQLVLLGDGGGSALIKPDGSRAAEGAIVDIGPRAMVGIAVIRGEPGRLVRVDLPPRIALYSPGGGSITFDQVTSDLPALPRLDSAGRLSFRFGGRIRISGGAEGNYRGDLPITVEYP